MLNINAIVTALRTQIRGSEQEHGSIACLRCKHLQHDMDVLNEQFRTLHMVRRSHELSQHARFLHRET